jgi:hypothetical protein
MAFGFITKSTVGRIRRSQLVLLHGGGDTIETSFGDLLPALARTRRIVAFEPRSRRRRS